MLSSLKLNVETITNVLLSHKILLAITIVMVLFMLFNHPAHLILFLIAIIVSIEVGLLMDRFYKSKSYEDSNLNLNEREKIVIAGLVAGTSGFMVSTFTKMVLNQVEDLFTNIAQMVYNRDNKK